MGMGVGKKWIRVFLTGFGEIGKNRLLTTFDLYTDFSPFHQERIKLFLRLKKVLPTNPPPLLLIRLLILIYIR
jgi:hypothetical protein